MLTSVCVRWHAGRASWRPAAELFEAAAFEVATIDSDTTARAFVVPAHYSHSYPAARRRFGLYTRRGALVGCAVFSAPTQASVLRPWSMADAVELGRLVLLDEVPGNAESWFVARCFEQLRREFAGVVSFSDPEPRTDAAGVTFVGHIGTVYQALGATYTGRGAEKTQRIFADGTEFPNRAASKLRQLERGHRAVVEALVAHGAEAPSRGADLHAWMRAELARLTRTHRHRGNHRYAWGLTPAARRDLARSTPALTYPKFNSRACRVAPTVNTTCTTRPT